MEVYWNVTSCAKSLSYQKKQTKKTNLLDMVEKKGELCYYY